MGSIINPIYANLYAPVPGGNPTGSPLTQTGPGSSSGGNSLIPNTNPSATAPVSTNPYTSAPVFPANSGGYSSSLNLGSPGGSVPGALPGTPGGPQNSVQMAENSPFSFLNAMTPKDQSRLFDSLKKTYGDGMAHQILDFLSSGAGFNQQAINNLLASLQPGIERGTESLMSQFSASGNRFGSSAEIGLGDFLSNVNLNEGQLVTQMYQSALDNFMNVMMGTGHETAQAIQNSPSTLDQILSGIGIGGSVAGGLGAATGSGALGALGALAFI